MTTDKKSADVRTLEEGQEKNGYLYAIRLLAITKRSERELKKRLGEKGYAESAIEKIAKILKNQKYLNDLSLAKQQIEYSVSANPKGKKRIRFELKHKGLDETTINAAFADYDNVKEREVAAEIAERKFEQMQDPDIMKRLKRTFDFLARRGFDYDTCREITAKLRKQHENK